MTSRPRPQNSAGYSGCLGWLFAAVVGFVAAAVWLGRVSDKQISNAFQHVSASSVLSFTFTLIVHAILLVALIFALIQLVRLAFEDDTNRPQERLFRIASLVTGALIAFGTKATGISIPDLIGQSLSLSDPLWFAVVGVVLPGSVGLLFGWYLGRVTKHGGNIAIRVLIFSGSLMVALFADVYAHAVGTSGFGLSPNLVPNVLFLVGLGVYVSLGMDTGRTGRPPGGQGHSSPSVEA